MNNLSNALDRIYILSNDISDSLKALEISYELKKDSKLQKLYIAIEELAWNTQAVRRNLNSSLIGEDFAYHLGKLYSRSFYVKEHTQELLQTMDFPPEDTLIKKISTQISNIELEINKVNPYIASIFSIS